MAVLFRGRINGMVYPSYVSHSLSSFQTFIHKTFVPKKKVFCNLIMLVGFWYWHFHTFPHLNSYWIFLNKFHKLNKFFIERFSLFLLYCLNSCKSPQSFIIVMNRRHSETNTKNPFHKTYKSVDTLWII